MLDHGVRARAGIFFILTGLASLVGCSSAIHTPAPVQVLNSQYVQQEQVEDHYVVKAGDTLFGIGWQTGHDYRAIAKLNKIHAPYLISAGQRLQLPTFKDKDDINVTAPVKPKSPTQIKVVKKNPVDNTQNGAYGEKTVSNSKVHEEPKGTFASNIAEWVWPATGNVIRDFSSSEIGFKGLTIGAPVGAAVRSAARGKVVYAGNALRGYGNLIIIKHTESLLTAYAHLQTINVKEQQWVQIGEVIGTVGSTGTDSPKLHFEMRKRGKSIDPQEYLPKR